MSAPGTGLENRSGGTAARACQSCGRRLLPGLALFAPLHSKDAANFHGYLEPSLRFFWPDAFLVAGLDDDDSPGFEEELLAGGTVRQVRRCGLRPQGLEPWGWQMLLTWLEGEKMQDFRFIGVIDADAVITAPVIEDTLFEDGRPVMMARVGPPRNAAWHGHPVRTWAWLSGIPWRLDCMTHFPFIAYREHLAAFREYVELLHGKSFTEAYLDFASRDLYVLHTAFCNFLWEFEDLRSAYSWHLMEEPGAWEGRIVKGQAPLEELRGLHRADTASRLPWPGATLHAGHWISLGKLRGACATANRLVPQCGSSKRPPARTARLLLEGICRSLPVRAGESPPKSCLDSREAPLFRDDEAFPAFFSHSSDERGWLVSSPEECLTAQRRHLAKVRRALAASPTYEADLRELAAGLELEARAAELSFEEVGEAFRNGLVEELCSQGPCRELREKDRLEVRDSVRRATELLLQARDAYWAAEAAAFRSGLVLPKNELRRRVFEEL